MSVFLALVSPAPLFDRTQNGRAFVPTASWRAAARTGGPGRPSGRRVSALPWTAGSPAARWPALGTSVFLITLSVAAPGSAQPLAGRFDVSTTITEAAARFALPEAWIRGVMGVESAYQPRAVSRAGAIGLMQVMPATYADLRARYGLGADPFLPRDNVLAGAAYLREMFDRFGAPGFLAAYNAGPARYLRHVAEGRPLPAETRAYVARLAPVVGSGSTLPSVGAVGPAGVSPPPPSVFVALRGPSERPVMKGSSIGDPAGAPLFVVISTGSSVP